MWIKTIDKRDEYTVEYTNMDSGMWMRVTKSEDPPSYTNPNGRPPYISLSVGHVLNETLNLLRESVLWGDELGEEQENVYNGIIDMVDVYLNQGENYISFPGLVDLVIKTLSMKTPKPKKETL
ncbi:MAG TPA: hypothetical protein PLP59_12815 [Thermotogota bacterium]|jgi:hypothetical protein|nr:hypothetical protein [Thermotogota bacterium]